MPKKEYPVKFIRIHKRTWVVHKIDNGFSAADENKRYRWRFLRIEAPRVIRRLAKFGLKAEAEAEAVDTYSVCDEIKFCHIYVTFKNDEEEAEFMMKSLANIITVTDYHYTD